MFVLLSRATQSAGWSSGSLSCGAYTGLQRGQRPADHSCGPLWASVVLLTLSVPADGTLCSGEGADSARS